LKWQAALLVWRVLLVGFVFVSIYLCVCLTGTEYLWLKFGLAALASFSFFPLTETLVEGQIDPLILLFWVAGIYFLEKGHSFWSALSFALGTLVKVSPAIVVALFLLRRRWTWLLSYAASIAGFTAISIWCLGWNNHVLFVKEVLPRLSCGIPMLANRSLPGFLYNLYLHRVPLMPGSSVPAWLCRLAKILGPLLLLACLYLLWQRNKSKIITINEFMAFALLSLLISPVSWRHHYLLALLPLIFMWSSEFFRSFDLAVLTIVTLSIGTVLPDYIITAIRNPALDLLLVSVTPISTLLLLWIYCANRFEANNGEVLRVANTSAL
jgi:Glycosyltransferase family 87